MSSLAGFLLNFITIRVKHLTNSIVCISVDFSQRDVIFVQLLSASHIVLDVVKARLRLLLFRRLKLTVMVTLYACGGCVEEEMRFSTLRLMFAVCITNNQRSMRTWSLSARAGL